MRNSILLSITALAACVAAVPHARPHAHGHRHAHEEEKRDYYVVTHYVTVTAEEPAVTPAPDFAQNVGVDNNRVDAGCNQPDPPGFNGFTPGGFTPCGFTPRVTATAATVVIGPNGQKSVSHLEQTLGLSTAARTNPTAPAVAPNSKGGAGDPVSFPQDPSNAGPPTHDFEVIVNEPPQPGGRDYPGTILLQTNFHRRNQSAGDVIWGFALQRIAQDMANTCNFQQNLNAENGGYGQALVAGVAPTEVGKVISETFYNNQVNNFNYYGQAQPPMDNFNNWGFFTQLVWKSTQQIGCYSVDCSGKGGLKGKPAGASDGFTVCNFWPAGNVDGQYAQNVGPQGDWPTMSWSDSTWSQVSGGG